MAGNIDLCKLKFQNIIEAYLRINFHFAGYTEY